ncbi:transglycosylase domain-containing protein [Sphingobacterium cellulitidis]|uniref:transglycosylase domain-containing protein n=1 Tax=Sphingobacterium cellulitidis TaxID=1768011 RepID=UPI000B93BA61|nr:penicillin-binding protein [Sphingobacterium cellulitidis]
MLDKKRFKVPDFSFVKKRWFIISAASVLAVLLIGFIYAMSIRGDMLNKAVAKVQKKLKEDYQLNFEVQKYEFAGLTTVDFQKVKIYPDSAEQLAAIDQFKVSVKLFPLLSGTVQLDELDLKNADITLVKHDSTSNYDFLFRKRAEQDSTKTKQEAKTLAETIDNLLKRAFQAVPDNLNLENVSLSFQDSATTQVVRIPEGLIDDGDYDIDVFLNEQEAKWNFKGNINSSRQTMNVIISSDNKDAKIPFIGRRFGLNVSFDELSFHLDNVSRKGKESLEMLGGVSAKNLRVNHKRLSLETIVLPGGSANGGFLVSENTIELVQGTKVEVKDFSFEPKLKFSRKPKKILEMAVHTGMFKAQDFFDALPVGLFETLDGIQVEGDIQYDMDFNVDLDDPDELKFSSKINDQNLKIKKWGKANIADLNGPFVYEAYEDTLKMRDIRLDATNPNFAPLGQIAPILKKTVLNTEDPFFYKHNGFELEAFELSIVTNIKEKKFKRGASTISMQLIKNLYLNRNKTMMRKFEEILLVWLMEQSKQVSKDRLLEIYLNIIEWGKNVYGISEASKYYFGKKPSELTIGESLYLSSIIPRPKTGLSSFDYTGHLKPWVLKHFNTYGYIMNKLNQLEGENVPANYGFYQVELQSSLRPPRPKGIPDSMMTHDDIKDIVDEIDKEEQIRKTLLEKLFGKSKEEENN